LIPRGQGGWALRQGGGGGEEAGGLGGTALLIGHLRPSLLGGGRTVTPKLRPAGPANPGCQRAARPLAGRGPSLSVRASSASPSPDPFPRARSRFNGPRLLAAGRRPPEMTKFVDKMEVSCQE